MTELTFHSYQGQDRLVLQACGRQRGGFFLDSGASNGVRGSNTKLFEDYFGWDGICIEPNLAMFAELTANRSCVCLNLCLYDREGEVDFFEAAGVYGGILSEYDPAHLEFARRCVGRETSGTGTGLTTKKARTAESVLGEHGAPAIIDYWSLDTEGSELAILRSFPFDRYRVRFISVEHNNTPMREAIARLLASHSYRRIGCLGIDDVYAWSDPQDGASSHSLAWSRAFRRDP